MEKVTSYKLRVTSAVLTVLRSYGLTVLLLLTFCMAYGQMSTREEPVSITREIPAMRINEQTQKIMPFLDMQKIEQEDAEDNLHNIPPRFGYPHEVDFTLENSGEWITLPEGDKIWRLRIYCPNATSINLLYDHFWLPEGAKFFIYSNDYREQLGAFTSKNNKGKKEDIRGFSTGLIFSNNITLEYYLPKEAEDMGIISVSRVVHGYRGLGSSDSQDWGFNASYHGHKNATCNPSFKNEKDAVVLIINNGNTYCTGSLVNTTANEINDSHFILTVEECIMYFYNPTNLIFYWHYESHNCTPNQPSNEPPLIYTQGATVVASSKKGNFALLALHDDPAEQWDVLPYYLGWDRSGTVPTGEKTIIHHPKGDIKKIVSTSSSVTPGYIMGHNIWEINKVFTYLYDPIAPEMGSEGAPLLNSNHKLIALFSHGSGGCYDDYNCDYFAKFEKLSWAWDNDNASNPSARLKDWLDPLNTDATILEGRGNCQTTIRLWHLYPKSEYHAVQYIISKQTIPNGVTTSYKAGTEIQLIDGFHAKSGSTFHAKIEEHTGCGGKQSTSFSSPGGEQNTDYAMGNPNALLSQNQTPNKVNILPNPNSGTFQIETNFALTDILHTKVVNLLGVTVYEAQNPTSNTIQLPNSASGQHLVVIMLKDGTVLTQKMMVQR